MDDDEWARWSATVAAMPWPNVRVSSPCHDCTADFAASMRAVGSCDGVPGACRPRLEDTPQRLRWREASERMRQRRMATA